MFSAPLYRLSIIDRPLAKGKGEVCIYCCKTTLEHRVACLLVETIQAMWCLQVSLSAFSFLFSELVQYCQTRVSNIGELERRYASSCSLQDWCLRTMQCTAAWAL